MDEQKHDMDNPKVVCFLGAGASVWAGIPTFSDFQKKAEEIYDKLPDSYEKEVFEAVLNDWRTHYNNSNIEDYYSTIEMHETLNLNHIEDFTVNKIVTVICNTIQESKHTKLPGYHFLLTQLLQNEHPGSDLIFLTTNWDILLESSRNHYFKNGCINYGKDILAYDIIPSNETKTDEQYDILKLHGSLNWGFCNHNNCQKIYYTDEKNCNILHSSSGLKCNECKSKLEPVIIPPALSKLAKAKSSSKYSKLIPIWSSAYEHLRSCENIYFIGYSLPETDVEIKRLLLDSLRRNQKLKEVVIITDQKYGHSRIDFEERYHSIISRIASNPRVKIIDYGFEKFLKENPYVKSIINHDYFHT